MTYGPAMGNIWILYGLLLSISNPLILMSLIWDCYVFGAAPYIPHSIQYENDMVSHHSKTMGMLCILHHPIPFPYHPSKGRSDMGMFSPCYTIPISFHWHTTAGMGMLWVVIKHHTIPTLSKHTPTDMGLLQVVKHHHQDVKMTDDIEMISVFWIPAPLSVYG